MKIKRIQLICILTLLCCTQYLSAQVEAKLVYPVVPIVDDCHLIFDDTTSVQVISKEQFLALDKLWLTNDFCYEQTKDTFYAKEFEVSFENIFGEVYAMYKEIDGHLNSEYQSSLNGMRQGVKSYCKVYFTGIKYEIDGALFQVKSFAVIIDSIVNPKVDSCWTQMPLDDNFTGHITIDSLIYLFKEKFGYNNCTKEQYWPDSSGYALIVIAPKQDANVDAFIPSIALNTKRDLANLVPMIKDLKAGDIVEIDPLVYMHNNELYKSRRIRYTIVDSIIPRKTLTLENIGSFIIQIKNIRDQENSENICLNHNQENILSFKMIIAPKFGNASMASSSNSCLTPQMIQMIKELEIGDKLIFERIKTPDPYHKTHYNVIEPIVITIE